MTRSESIANLAAALAVAQGAIKGASKDKANPFFKSKYADLASVWEACRGPLSANGLSVVQLPALKETEVTLTTLLLHATGEWIATELTAPLKEITPQAIGSLVTYLRRYSLAAIVGVAPDEDDDAEAAMGRKVKPASEKEQAEACAAFKEEFSIAPDGNAIDGISARVKAAHSEGKLSDTHRKELLEARAARVKALAKATA